ncbi:hypothetical protein YC2023_069041 [Brassica napus]
MVLCLFIQHKERLSQLAYWLSIDFIARTGEIFYPVKLGVTCSCHINTRGNIICNYP